VRNMYNQKGERAYDAYKKQGQDARDGF